MLVVLAGCGNGAVYTDADRDVIAARLVGKLVVPVCDEGLRSSGAGGLWTSVLVRADGPVGDVQALEGVGQDGKRTSEYTDAVKRYGCDKVVAAAVEQFTFEPAEKNGRPVAYRMEIGVTFDTSVRISERQTEPALSPARRLRGPVVAGSRDGILVPAKLQGL